MDNPTNFPPFLVEVILLQLVDLYGNWHFPYLLEILYREMHKNARSNKNNLQLQTNFRGVLVFFYL
jgi:hypothetical protein